MTLREMESGSGAQILAFSVPSGVVDSSDGRLTKDPVLERLVRSLLPPDEAAKVLRGHYTDIFHAKLVQQLEYLRNEAAHDDGSRQLLSLPEWRLKRVVAYVERNMDQPLTLPCMARAAGLSRMHFAVLFRRATGLRPHEYVTQRRIERAQQLLSASEAPIVEIALNVGFQSQSHFTSIFRRVVGTTPHKWRLLLGHHELAA